MVLVEKVLAATHGATPKSRTVLDGGCWSSGEAGVDWMLKKHVIVPFLPVSEGCVTNITDPGISNFIFVVGAVVRLYLTPAAELSAALFTLHLSFAVKVFYDVLVRVQFEVVFNLFELIKFIEKRGNEAPQFVSCCIYVVGSMVKTSITSDIHLALINISQETMIVTIYLYKIKNTCKLSNTIKLLEDYLN